MTSFSTRIRPIVQAELNAAASAEAQGRFHTAFEHMERAHVVGQPSTVEHVRVHWRMFRFALRNRRPAEAYGQAWRLAAATCTCTVGGTCGGVCTCTGDCACTARNQQPSAHTGINASACHCALASGQVRASGQETSWTAAGAVRADAPPLLGQCANCSCAWFS
jgi:hypothetical protein